MTGLPSTVEFKTCKSNMDCNEWVHNYQDLTESKYNIIKHDINESMLLSKWINQGLTEYDSMHYFQAMLAFLQSIDAPESLLKNTKQGIKDEHNHMRYSFQIANTLYKLRQPYTKRSSNIIIPNKWYKATSKSDIPNDIWKHECYDETINAFLVLFKLKLMEKYCKIDDILQQKVLQYLHEIYRDEMKHSILGCQTAYYLNETNVYVSKKINKRPKYTKKYWFHNEICYGILSKHLIDIGIIIGNEMFVNNALEFDVHDTNETEIYFRDHMNVYMTQLMNHLY